MRIRKATEKDQGEFSNLYHLLYSDDENVKAAASIPMDQSNFINLLLVAEENNKLIGFIWGYLVSLGLRRYGYVEDIFVKKKYRNQGVATSLIAALKERFIELKVDAVFVTTEKENQEAINFYKKERFELCLGPWFYWKPL